MKRYDLYIYTEGAELKEEPDGNYVKWEDVQEILKLAQKETMCAEEFYYRIERIFDLYEN